MKKSIEFEYFQHEFDDLFEIDAGSNKKTWFTFMTLKQLRSQGCNNFQLFHQGKRTRNYYTSVTCYHVISLVKGM